VPRRWGGTRRPRAIGDLIMEEMTEALSPGPGDSRSILKLQLRRAGVELAVDAVRPRRGIDALPAATTKQPGEMSNRDRRSSSADRPRPQEMSSLAWSELVRGGNGAPSIRAEDTLTGEVQRDAVLRTTRGETIGNGCFSCARSRWHTREVGQILIVVAAGGYVAERLRSAVATGPSR
jgi:hypothetical protein